MILEDVRCSGREERLIDCISRGILASSCPHSEDAGVSCVAGMNTYKGTTCVAIIGVECLDVV